MRAATVYLLIRGITALLFYTAYVTAALYLIAMAQLDPLRLVLVGTALELSVVLLEIPTGVVADVYSRRLSVILGYSLIGAGFLLQGALPLFPTILLAQVIWGAGFTFTSGAQDAWLADEEGEEALAHLYLRGTQASQVGSFLGVGLSVALASWRLNWALVGSGLGFLALALGLLAVMPERRFRPTPGDRRESFRQMWTTFRTGVAAARRRRVLRTLMAIALFGGVASEGIDRLWEAHLLANFAFPAVAGLEPVHAFGILNAVAMLSTLAVTETARRRLERLPHRGLVAFLAALQGLVVVALVVFALAGSFLLAATAWTAIYVLRQTAQPLMAAWINRGLDPKVRATVLSTVNQFDALGQVGGGPLLGAVARGFGLRAAMLGVAGLLLPVLALFGVAWRQDDTDG